MIAHESLEQFSREHAKSGIGVHPASFCAGHDYVLHSEQVQGLVKALEHMLVKCDMFPNSAHTDQARAALNSFKGV